MTKKKAAELTLNKNRSEKHKKITPVDIRRDLAKKISLE